ncbi:MAG: amidohydrolase [Actinomycetota bacterium]|nr:amidohydrolase [Actinomycetota bacterium]
MTSVSQGTLFTNGTVWTGRTTTHALAVSAGRVVATGADALDLASGWTVEDLEGGLALPAFRDGHAHPLSGGRERNGLDLADVASIDAVLAAVADWLAAHPGNGWVRGSNFSLALFGPEGPEARVLDRVTGDRPVALFSDDHHTCWVNSAALAAAGLDADAPDPALGAVRRYGDGTPTGALFEWGALALIEAMLPDVGLDEHLAGLATGQRALARNGIVWALDAAVGPEEVAAYEAAARAGALTCRFDLATRLEPGRWRTRVPTLVAERDRFAADPELAPWVTTNTVKFFADGVIEGRTGYLLEPYHDHVHDCGLPNWDAAELAEAATAFDAAGFEIHVHAIGDGGIRMALDAIEHAITRNGVRPRRPVIAHTQLVDPGDRPRFARLGVIANFEPLWACLDPGMVELTIPRLGPERSMLQYPIESIRRTGARISFGSDWPVTSISPLRGLAVAVTRQTPAGEPVDGWIPDERVAIADALAAYTSGVAVQAGDHDAGRLEPGERADVCVLEADITALSGREIADVAVRSTWVGGNDVYRRASSGSVS